MSCRRWLASSVAEAYESPMNRALLLLLAGATLAPPALAQSDDAAYCATLYGLALRYVASDAGLGANSPDLDMAMAREQCRKGDTATGIAALERKLRNRGFSPPKR
jgi:hypothetical protein